MIFKVALKLFIYLAAFVLMFLLGLASFNLFYADEKIQMMQVALNFHNGQVNNDKDLIDNSLADSFTETGEKRFVQTPSVIYKEDLMNNDYSEVNFSIEAQYSVLLNLFRNNNKSLSFMRKLEIFSDNGIDSIKVYYHVTYLFEKEENGLKIKKVVRNF